MSQGLLAWCRVLGLTVVLLSGIAVRSPALAGEWDPSPLLSAIVNQLKNVDGRLRVQWMWMAVHPLVPAHGEAFERAADRPLSTGIANPFNPGLTAVVGAVLHYGVPNADPVGTRRAEELRLYRRLLFCRRQYLFGLFAGRYFRPFRDSRFIRKYWRLYGDWAKTVDAYRRARTNGAPPAETKKRRDALHAARTKWDRRGHRKILTVMLERYRFDLSEVPSAAWSRAQHEFLNGGGWSSAADQEPGPVQFRHLRGHIGWETLPAAVGSKAGAPRDYATVELVRPWLDSSLLFADDWVWTSTAPNHDKLADGTSCDVMKLVMPCLSERAVLVRFRGEGSPVFLAGFIGEVLPPLPPGIGEGNQDDVLPDLAPSRAVLSSRLRNGTF